jgi:hypothetical protein
MVDYPVVELATTRTELKHHEVRIFDDHGSPDFSTLNEFVLADTDKKMAEFAREWQPLFYYAGGEYVAFPMFSARYGEFHGTTLADYKDARSVLVLAMSLRALLDNDGCTIENLRRLGMEFDHFDAGDWFGIGVEDIDSYQLNHRRSLHGRNYFEYLRGATEDLNTPVDECELVGVFEWDKYMRERWNSETHEQSLKLDTEENSNAVLYLATVGFPNNHDGLRRLVKQALDEIITVHLYDIRTTTINGGSEYRKCGSLLSSLWYCMVRSFEGGRAGRCEVCGRPFVSKGERGKPRKYCTSACSKWAQRHPGQTR